MQSDHRQRCRSRPAPKVALLRFRRIEARRGGRGGERGSLIPDSPACQGRTMHVVDAERKDPDDLDAAWLHLYAMLSRATKVKHIMLMRGPGPELLPRGPPADLAARLRAFDPCAERRWGEAEQLATHSLAQFLC
ncbi:unnamed protein product [Prorocentrum cordatum]|uniref:DNA helicase n=1 Tax=Prorocentrum cordatum TaxID=2364126 RepID=A0ABN9PDS6_9DINO|nr:unnamed protein product [Polarella glacialis]